MLLGAALRKRHTVRPASRSTPDPSILIGGEDDGETPASPASKRLKFPAYPAPTLPAAVAADSEKLRTSRLEIQRTISTCLAASVTESTTRTYESTLSNALPRIEAALGVQPLPLDTEDKFLAFYGAAFHVASTKTNPASPPKWSHLRMLKAASDFWHSMHGHTPVSDLTWTTRMGAFWKGLKRSCSHAQLEKEALSLPNVKDCLLDGARAFDAIPSDPALFASWYEGNKRAVVALRTAACVAVGFFGIRRASEVTQLRCSDVTLQDDGSITLSILRQKNDQEGLGQLATIPPMNTWGDACPVKVLLNWIRVRDLLRVACDREGRMKPGANLDPNCRAPSNPLFVAVRGPRWGFALRTDALNGAMRAFFGRLVSPRKGGTQFYLTNAAPRAAVQGQGGWHSQTTMDAVYAKFAAGNVAAEVKEAASRGEQEMRVTSYLQDLSHPCEDFENFDASTRTDSTRRWLARTRVLEPYLTPGRVHKVCPNFLELLSVRYNALALEGKYRTYALDFSSKYRSELRLFLRMKDGEKES